MHTLIKGETFSRLCGNKLFKKAKFLNQGEGIYNLQRINFCGN